MHTDVEDQHLRERLSQTFALLTAKLEDAAELAARGQKPQSDTALAEITKKVEILADEVATVAGTLATLLAR